MTATKPAPPKGAPEPAGPATGFGTAFAALKDRQPLLLLPTRLETCFQGRDLKIRIYPDQIHVNQHHPLLTESERTLGETFWKHYRKAKDEDGRQAAETWLTGQVPGRRAPWVALQTRPEIGPDGQPSFPSGRTRVDAPPPTAVGLPARFAAVGYCKGEPRFVRLGEPVPDALAISPQLEGAVAWSKAEGSLPVDAGFAWMIDYDEAVKVGMGITVSLEQVLYDDIAASGLTLFVVGVREETPQKGVGVLERLLEAHLYTDGLEFVPQGTPTNNTDAADAGWTEKVDDIRAWFHRELVETGADSDGESNAARLSRALGLTDSRLLQRALHGQRDEERSMRAMNVVLWPVTWGRYFHDLLAPPAGQPILPRAAIDRVHEMFVASVRGGACLPVIAIGPQPYGVLPVQRTGEGQPLQWPRDALELVLLDLKERWRAALPEVPRLDPILGDRIGSQPKDDVVAVLGSLPHPGRFAVRRLVHDGMSHTYWPEEDAASDPSPIQTWARWYVDRLPGIDTIAAQVQLVDDWAGQLNALVTASARPDARQTLDLVRQRVNRHLRRQRPLDRLASAYYDSVYASDRKPTARVPGPRNIWSDFDYYGVDEPGVDYSVPEQGWNRVLVQDPQPAAGESAAEYLAQLANRLGGQAAAGSEAKGPASLPLLYQLVDSVVDRLSQAERQDYRLALRTLASLAADDVERLELRLREALGLASHRLDAWFTALAQERLDDLRQPNAGSPKTGIQLGGFGWVLDLRPDSAGGLDSQGYVHAPSLGHAATAAVLRAGWNAHGTRDPNSLMAVDLRSDRVRLGAWLLDGIRQGQPLGDLLGCRFELDLRDADRAEFIDACRRAVLTSRGIKSDPRGPVDGLELVALYQGQGLVLAGVDEPLRPDREPAANLRPVRDTIERIVRAMDAVADVSIADSVHHLLQGNADRASATLDAITTGAVAPPELRFLETPRPGASVTHRVIVLLEGDPSAPTPAAGLMQDLAEMNAALDAWLATMMGDLHRVICLVRFPADSSEAAPAAIPVSLGGLKISATNVVMGAPQAPLDDRSEWGRRVAAAVLGGRPEFEGRLAIEFDPPVKDDQVSFETFAQLARALRSLLGRSRPQGARDLEMPGSAAAMAWDVTDAEDRLARVRVSVEASVGELEMLVAELVDGKAAPQSVSAAALMEPMIRLADLGLANAVPTAGWAPDSLQTLIAEARSLAVRGRSRLKALEEAWQSEDTATASTAGAPADEAKRIRRAREAVRTLLGRKVPLLPRFACTNSATATQAFARGRSLLNDDPTAATTWLGKVAKVRRDVAHLDEVLTLSELLVDRTVLSPVVGQLPDQDVWVATAAPADRRKGYLCLWALEQRGLEAMIGGRALAGLVVDSWLEQIPAPDVISGIAMHFDAPTSRAPQSLLLVMPPKGEAWSFDLVMDSLIETLEAAQLRAVDPDILDAYGHQIPAIYAPGRLDAGALLGTEPNG